MMAWSIRVLLALSASVALAPAGVQARTSRAASSELGPRITTAKEARLTLAPGGAYVGVLEQGEHFDVQHITPHRWAWGWAYGHARKCAWTKLADLAAEPSGHLDAKHHDCGAPRVRHPGGSESRYRLRIRNSLAGGGGSTFHVGSPINVTVVDRHSSHHRTLTLCMSPAPIDKPSCREGVTNRTIASLAPSKPGVTKVTARFADGSQVTRHIEVRPAA